MSDNSEKPTLLTRCHSCADRARELAKIAPPFGIARQAADLSCEAAELLAELAMRVEQLEDRT